MKLTNVAAKGAKPKEKAYKLADGGGLYLEIFPNGSKLWRLKYRRDDGSETRISLGAYPEVPILDARSKREALKKQRREGIDPAVERKLEKLRRREAAENSVEAVARQWFKKIAHNVTPGYLERVVRRFERDIFPYLGRRPIEEVTAPELLPVLQRIEARGAIETAHRARADFGGVFRYAIACGIPVRDISGDLRGALAKSTRRHFATLIKPTEIGGLLRAIDAYHGTVEVRAALRLAPLTFVRPVELRSAEWSELDLDLAEWRIPAPKMKMRFAHIVPLSTQAITVLRELEPLTGRGKYVFPGVRSPMRPMSENTVNAALRRLGYTTEDMTGHGFRHMASTLLNEQGWNPDAIERQLAHGDDDEVRATYNFAEYLPERKRMMQSWADYLDSLKSQAKAPTFERVAVKRRRGRPPKNPVPQSGDLFGNTRSS